jgi:hypothetical protein
MKARVNVLASMKLALSTPILLAGCIAHDNTRTSKM